MTGTSLLDRFEVVRAVADAVCYEGYIIYPYRASSRKNRTRWQFGVLTPRAFSEQDGYERWRIHNECLLEADGTAAVLAVRVRCLQLQRRGLEAINDGEAATVHSLEVGGRVLTEWDEAVQHDVDLPLLYLGANPTLEHLEELTLAGGEDTEELRGDGGELVGRVVHQRQELKGRVRVRVAPVESASGRSVKVELSIENASEWSAPGARREDALGHSLLAVNSMLAVEGARFASLLEPPESLAQAARSCVNDGSFPVLASRDDDVVLCSPIILYDHPDIAPESPGDLYDSTEIDEILALRVLTLTDDEKAEARATDPRAAAVIDRCDAMTPEVWGGLHGAVRSLRRLDEAPEAPFWDPAHDASHDPESDAAYIGGVAVKKGSKVRLVPSRGGDAQDFFVAGRTATVAAVMTDLEGSQHVAVTVDDDPATAELVWQGRYLYFHPEEVLPLLGGEGDPQ